MEGSAPELRAARSPSLSASQLAMLSQLGETRTADVGDVLYSVGEHFYSFLAILEGEVSVLDPAGNELVRHRESGFIGEVSLLSGQTALVSVVVTRPLRYIAVEREVFRSLLYEQAAFSELVLSTFVARHELLQQVTGVGLEIVGPHSSSATMQMVDFARSNRIPFTWRDPERAEDAAAPGVSEDLDEASLPLVRLPGGATLERPTPGQVYRALGIGLELSPREDVDLLVVGGGPAGLGAAVYGASEGLNTLVIESTGLGGQAGTSRRIENYLGFPGGITGSELTGRAITQARKFKARFATPYRAVALEADHGRHVVRLEEGGEISAQAVLIATGAQYRRLPVDDLDQYEGISVFYAAGPPEAQVCAAARVGVVGGGNSAGQAAVWLARGGSLVTLLHRRADLRETMSDYLVRELEHHGVAVHDHSEIAALHGAGGQLDGVTLTTGEHVALSYLFLFLGAAPCTDWIDERVQRDEHGFILTGPAAGAETLLETSVPGILAAGDVRSGSSKRCATAVGEGAWAVQLVHATMAAAVR